MLMQQLNVCDIRGPDLIQSGYCCTLQKVWMYWQSVAGIGCNWLEQLPMAQQVVHMHEPQHPLVINRKLRFWSSAVILR